MLKKSKVVEIAKPLRVEEIEQYKQLPVLTLPQIARVLQKTVSQVREMTRERARRPLPVFRSGKSVASTWDRIQKWIGEGFEERAA